MPYPFKKVQKIIAWQKGFSFLNFCHHFQSKMKFLFKFLPWFRILGLDCTNKSISKLVIYIFNFSMDMFNDMFKEWLQKCKKVGIKNIKVFSHSSNIIHYIFIAHLKASKLKRKRMLITHNTPIRGLSTKKRLRLSLSCRFLEYAGNEKNQID